MTSFTAAGLVRDMHRKAAYGDSSHNFQWVGDEFVSDMFKVSIYLQFPSVSTSVLPRGSYAIIADLVVKRIHV